MAIKNYCGDCGKLSSQRHRRPVDAPPLICHPCRAIRRGGKPARKVMPPTDKRSNCEVCGVGLFKPSNVTGRALRRCHEHRNDSMRWCARCNKKAWKSHPRNVLCRACFSSSIRKDQVVLYVKPSRVIREQWIPSHQVTWKSIQCAVCDQHFISKWYEATCSTQCLKVHRLNLRRMNKQKRRARKHAAYVAPVYREKIWELDAYKCHLCGRKTDPTKQVPHPLAPTIDHVIPLAAGGTHEPANCRTAHYRCNNIKGARGGGEQLALDIA